MPEENRTELRDQLIHQLLDRLRELFADGKMLADKRAVMEKMFTQLMQDATIRTILK